MTELKFAHNRETNVAYVDVYAPEHEPQGRVHVLDVTSDIGFRTQVLARVTEEGELLGLVIEDYSAFRREVRFKYLALAVERLLDLLVSKVREVVAAEERHTMHGAAARA